MRTILTTEDMRNIFDKMFNGNLSIVRHDSSVVYENANSEDILMTNQETAVSDKQDLAKYLNVQFYAWKNRLVEKGDNSIVGASDYTVFETWLESLNFSLNESYALVETIDEEVTASQDIDYAEKSGQITFIIQSDKVKNLDYYISKIRNSYLGAPQTIQNAFGEIINAYIIVGTPIYEQEPITVQVGECLIVKCNFKITYLTNAYTYNDTEVYISLTGDDTYSNGEIVGNTKYIKMPLTKLTWQNIFSSTPLPTAQRPDLTGFVASTLTSVKTITFYDFDKELTNQLNDLFWRVACYRYDGIVSATQDINIPVFIKVKTKSHTYVFKDMIDNMQKVVTNNDFTISSLTLKGWGKVI